MSRIAGRKPARPPVSSPDPSPPPEAAATHAAGRDERGRFTKANKGGPGNPFARQTAALRKQLLDAVTPEVMAQICTALLLRAQGGNLAAIKLIFSYILGRPAEVVNPDTLDHEEMQQYARDIGMDKLMDKVLLSVPAELACECVRVVRPDVLDRVVEAAARQDLNGGPRADRNTEAEAGAGQAAPSPNRVFGQPEADGPPDRDGGDPPMGNGGDGESAGVAEAGRDHAPEDGAPSAIGANRSVAARETAGGRRPECPREAGRVNPVPPGPRQAPPWAGSRPAAPSPQPRGPGRSGGPPPQG